MKIYKIHKTKYVCRCARSTAVPPFCKLANYGSTHLPIRRHSMIGSSFKYTALVYFVFCICYCRFAFFRLSVYYRSSQLPIRQHSMIGSSLKYIALLYFVFVGILYLFLNMCISDLLIHQLVGTSRWTHSSKPSSPQLACS